MRKLGNLIEAGAPAHVQSLHSGGAAAAISSRMFRLVLAVVLLSLPACKKELRLEVKIPEGLDPGQVRLVAAGKALDVHGQPYVETNWSPDKRPDRDTLEVELEARLPCGTKRFKVKPTDAPPLAGTDRVVADFTAQLGPTAKLILDPALAGGLPWGEFQLPSPLPTRLTVAFGDCPRELEMGGSTVPIPVTDAPVLLAQSEERCFQKGIANYGTGCAADTSEKLTGARTYVMKENLSRVFEPLPTSISARERCDVVTWLQVCRP